MFEITIVPEPVQKQMDHNFCHIPKFITLLVKLVSLSYISVAHRTVHYTYPLKFPSLSLTVSHSLFLSISLFLSDTRRTSCLTVCITRKTTFVKVKSCCNLVAPVASCIWRERVTGNYLFWGKNCSQQLMLEYFLYFLFFKHLRGA